MTYPPQPGPYGPSGGYGQPYPGQPYPGQPYPGQQYPGHPGQPGQPQQPYPGQPEYRGQFPNQPYQGQSGGYGRPYQDQHSGYSGGIYPHPRPGYGTPPGDVPPPPPEPPNRGGKTGMVVGITLALLLLAGTAVGITGFWQPGYFRDDTADKDSSLAADASPSDTTSPSSTRPQDAAPAEASETPGARPPGSEEQEIRRITDAVIAGINNRDAATVKPVSCDPSNERQADYDGFPDDLTVSVAGEPRIDGSDAKVALTLRRSDTSKTVTLTLRRANGAWCASGISS
ncbi:hypothetical protein [Haloechinothrix salitolerans]|uniref:DUF4878 domain-containing protein n=1 Tax=Haloechinothrix salitolerans TaxID=926830 RepID=A0ABW2C072_9PSEU